VGLRIDRCQSRTVLIERGDFIRLRGVECLFLGVGGIAGIDIHLHDEIIFNTKDCIIFCCDL
jgi:hypothetical protein